MLPARSAKFIGLGPLTLARETHRAEDEGDDIDFLAIQDAVEMLTPVEQRIYQDRYRELHKPQHRQ